MKLLGVVLVVFLCIGVACSFRHHSHHKPTASFNEHCRFQTDKGSYDLRLLLRDMNEKDWELRDQKSQASFFYNPCGGVHNDKCPKGSALCVVNDKAAIDFGQADNITWTESGAVDGVEITYGNGERCANDIPRKTLVQLTCSKPTKEPETHRTVITDFTHDECFITLKVTSPYGCPVEQLCSVYEKKECESSEGLCGWKDGACVFASSSCLQFGRHHLPVATFIALVSGTILVLSISCIACLCCCRRRRMRNRNVLPTTTTEKKCSRRKSKKSKKTDPQEEVQIPDTQFIYQPLQQYPGQYAQGYAFPMVQLGTPTIQNE